MTSAKVRSRVLLPLGMILSAALLAACGGSDAPSASVTPPPSSNESAQIPSSDTPTAGSNTDSTQDNSSVTESDANTADPTPRQSAQPHAVTLSWQPPTANTNGSVLTNLSGYIIQYGTRSQDYTNSITLTNPGLTSYVVENLPAGTYYFSISATAASGAQSAPSAETTATVN